MLSFITPAYSSPRMLSFITPSFFSISRSISETFPVTGRIPTLIVVEASDRTDFSYLEELGFETVKSKDYKTNRHLFLKKRM